MKRKYGSTSVPESPQRIAFNLAMGEKNFYFKPKASNPSIEPKNNDVKESKKYLLITNRNNIKESKRVLVTKSKEPHPSKFTKSHSNGFIRFLDKNYKEKLFNINEEQKDILRKMSEKGILPMIPKNSSQDVFGPVQPFLSFDTRSEKMSQKLVDNALDKISTLLSPKFSRPPVKVKDDSRKLLSPMKQKQSIDHFKRQLASTGSLLRLLTQPNRRPMAGQHLRGEALYRSRELHVLHPPAFYSQTMLSSDGLPVKSELQRKIFTIHIKQDQVIKQHRKKLDTKEQNKLKGTRHDESSFAGDVYDGNWPFCT